MKRKSIYTRRGTTLIELSFVIGIAAVLLAMILGLAQHITRVSNISKARTVLAAWHMAMDNWHQTFGEYPGDIYVNGILTDTPYNWEFSELAHLQNTYSNASMRLNNETVNFRSYYTHPLRPPDPKHYNNNNRQNKDKAKLLDPWGTPYIYIRHENKQSYVIFSCGPDADSEEIELEAGRTRTHNTSLDNIYFER